MLRHCLLLLGVLPAATAPAAGQHADTHVHLTVFAARAMLALDDVTDMGRSTDGYFFVRQMTYPQ